MHTQPTVAKTFVETLHACGIDTCFTNPGTTELHLWSAFVENPKFKTVLCLAENVASGSADGYARVTGKTACTLLHLGPGLMNGMANLHNAKRAQSTILNIIGEHPQSHQEHDPPLHSPLETLAVACSKYTWTLTLEEHWEQTLSAFILRTQRESCISTVIVPSDLASTIYNSENLQTTSPSSIQSQVSTAQGKNCLEEDAETLKRFASHFTKQHHKGVLLISSSYITGEAILHAQRIASQFNLQLFTDTFTARLQRGGEHTAIQKLPYFPEMSQHLLESSHWFILGTKIPTHFFKKDHHPSLLVSDTAQVFHLPTLPDSLANTLDTLSSYLQLPTFIEKGTKVQKATTTSSLHPLPPIDNQLTLENLGYVLAQLMPEGAFISNESISSAPPLYAALQHTRHHDWLDLMGGAIGQGLPLATGIAYGAPNAQIIALQADGSAAYTLQALWTQARDNLNILTILLANRCYAILEKEMTLMSVPPFSASLSNPSIDWVQLANGFGVEAKPATCVETFRIALQEGLQKKQPYLIHAILA